MDRFITCISLLAAACSSLGADEQVTDFELAALESTTDAETPQANHDELVVAMNNAGRLGIAFSLHRADGQLVYRESIGSVIDFEPETGLWGLYPLSMERPIPIASASKLVVGVTLLTMVDQGILSLEDATGSLLGWAGRPGQITLRDLLSLHSGLPDSIEGVGLLISDNYFCRSTTIRNAGRWPALTGLSESRGSIRSNGYRRSGQADEAKAHGG